MEIPDFPVSVLIANASDELQLRLACNKSVGSTTKTIGIPMTIVTELLKRHKICEQIGEDLHCQALKGPMSQRDWNIDNVMEFLKLRLEFRRSTKKLDLDDNECAWVLAYVKAQVCDTAYEQQI